VSIDLFKDGLVLARVVVLEVDEKQRWAVS